MSLISSICRGIEEKRLIVLGAGIAAVYWFAETAMDVFVFSLGSFSDRLVPADLNEIWMRLLIVVFLVLFSIYAQALLVKCRGTEQDLRTERNLTTSILNTVGALVVVLDREGRIITFNRACEQTTGYTFEEVKNAPVWKIFLSPDEVDEVRTVFETLRSGKFPSKHENYWITKDGSRRLIEWSNTTLRDSNGSVRYVIGTGIDVTEKKQLELEWRNMLSMFAHDMKNPVMAAAGFVSRLLSGKEGPLSENQLAALDIINEACMALKDLIAGFLEFSRFESKDLKAVMLPYDLKTELYKIVEMAKPAASKKEIDVVVDIKEDAPNTITADAALIARAIKNLLDNAIKYTQRGGSVTARIMNEGTTTLIEIADTGIGISQDHLPFIFDPFYRAGEDSRGWGLGLAFVKKGIEAHGGAVRVKSTPGEGSTFTISLPSERT